MALRFLFRLGKGLEDAAGGCWREKLLCVIATRLLLRRHSHREVVEADTHSCSRDMDLELLVLQSFTACASAPSYLFTALGLPAPLANAAVAEDLQVKQALISEISAPIFTKR